MRLADLFDRNLYVDWAQTISLNCSWHDLFATPMNPFSSKDLVDVPSQRRFNRDAQVVNSKFGVPPTLDMEHVTDDLHVVTNCFLGHEREDRGDNFWNYSASMLDVGTYLGRLRPSADVSAIISAFLDQHGPMDDCIGLHVRRGTLDVAAARANFMRLSDGDYLKIVDRIAPPDARIHLATDSEDTRQAFQNALGSRMVTYRPRSLKKNEDLEAIQDAMVDFLLLSKCAEVVGINGSSFAHFASHVHGVPYTALTPSSRPDEVVVERHTYRDADGHYEHVAAQRVLNIG